MSNGIASLHKILKDETRQKVIILLNTRGSLTYTELLEELDVLTGILNYHLKVLNDLITKNATGQYLLTEKGKVAASLLLNFPIATNIAQKKRLHKIFWSILALGQIVTLVSFLALYYLGMIDSSRLLEVGISVSTGLVLSYFGYKMLATIPASDSDQMRKRMKIAYPLGGAWIAFATFFFSFFLGGALFGVFANPLLRLSWVQFVILFFMCIIAPALGGFWGNWVGKRNNYNQPKWIVWMNKKTGFA